VQGKFRRANLHRTVAPRTIWSHQRSDNEHDRCQHCPQDASCAGCERHLGPVHCSITVSASYNAGPAGFVVTIPTTPHIVRLYKSIGRSRGNSSATSSGTISSYPTGAMTLIQLATTAKCGSRRDCSHQSSLSNPENCPPITSNATSKTPRSRDHLIRIIEPVWICPSRAGRQWTK